MEQQESFLSRFTQFLPVLEKVALAGAFLGLLLKYLDKNGDTIILITLSTLAGIYYLMAFTRPKKIDDERTAPGDEGEKPGFAKLLFATILPKIVGIGCAIAIIGILFALLKMSGVREMLIIGATTTVLSTQILVYGVVTEDLNAKAMTPFLFRVIPCAAISIYLLMGVI